MELIGILCGMVFWPTSWLLWSLYCNKRRKSKRLRYGVLAVLVALPVLGALSLSKYMFLDEPLYMAASQGDLQQVRSLLSKGADPNVDFEGRPALEAAVQTGHAMIVRLLLDHGAQPNVRNEWTNKTPLASARSLRNPEIADMLVKAGAKE